MERPRARVRVGRSTRGRGRGMRVLRPHGKLSGGSTVKRSSSDGHVDNENPSPSKQSLTASSTSSSHDPLGANEISNVNLGYGCEENLSEDEFGDVIDTRPILVPADARILCDESEDKDEVQAWCLRLPHSVCTSPDCHSAASHSAPTPEPMPESEPKPEPDIKPKTEPTLSTGNKRSGRAKVRGGRSTRGRGRGIRVLSPRGKFSGRPTVKRSSFDGITCSTMKDLLETKALEKSLSPKKPRRLKHQASTPARHIQSDANGLSTLNSDRKTGRESAIKRTRHEDNEIHPASKQHLIASITLSSNEPLEENEVSNVNFCYGSEDDSDEEEGDDVVETQTISVPRTARILFDESEDEDQMQAVDATLCLQWPPQPYSSSRCHSAASHSTPTPEPMSESGPKTEPTFATQSVVPFEPTDKFSFIWKPFPQNQIQPNIRREVFSGINCGPTATYVNPYEAFTAIWDRNIMEHIAAETNRYAQQLQTVMQGDGTLKPNSRIRRWRDTDANELYVFFAVIIATGIVVKPRFEEYWNKASDIFSTSGFTLVMSYHRFLLLSRCLHFQNNDCCNPKSMTRLEAKLYKIKPILDHLNNKFATLYNMSQNVALDESLTMWKGWLDINQFIRNKAASVGIKTYEVCESQTGYLWRFEVHAGHTNASSPQDDDPVSGIVPSLVLRLLNGLEHKGHTIWMDNYYNSPVLARELKTRGFDCVGTLRTNRKFVPQEIQDLKKDEMALGQVFGCTSGDVDLVVWRDKKRVALISTYHGLATVKCSETLKPSIIPDYNICMGGVDRKDQMLAAYPIERKRTRVWYKKFFRRLLNASVLNSYILLRSQHTITHRSFRKTLVNKLILKHTPPKPHRNPQPAPLRCIPAQYDFIAGKHDRLRRACAVCSKRTNSYCKGCNVPLCVFTCFEPHHYRR